MTFFVVFPSLVLTVVSLFWLATMTVMVRGAKNDLEWCSSQNFAFNLDSYKQEFKIAKRHFRIALLLVPAAALWPLTLVGGVVYCLYLLGDTVRIAFAEDKPEAENSETGVDPQPAV